MYKVQQLTYVWSKWQNFCHFFLKVLRFYQFIHPLRVVTSYQWSIIFPATNSQSQFELHNFVNIFSITISTQFSEIFCFPLTIISSWLVSSITCTVTFTLRKLAGWQLYVPLSITFTEEKVKWDSDAFIRWINFWDFFASRTCNINAVQYLHISFF